MTTFEALLEHPQGRRAAGAAVALGAAVASFGFGVALVAIAWHLSENASPAVLLAIPLVPLVALGVLVAPVLAAITVFATFPVGAVTVPTGVIPLQTVELAVLAMVTVVVLRRLARAQLPLPWQPPLYWALALLVWSIVALHSAIDDTLALKQVASLFGGIIFAASMLAACRTMDNLRVVLGAFVAVTAGIAATSFSGGVRLKPAYGAESVAGRLSGAFEHPNQLGALCALGISVALGLAFGARRAQARVAAAVAVVVIATALTFTLSRGAWIGTALALLFLLVALSEVRRALIILIVPGIIVIGLIASFVPVGQSEIKVVGERARALTALSPYDNRREIYAEAWREIRANPVTGVGPGGFPIASARAGSRTSTYAVAHAHNLLLTWGAEAGLPAVLFILGLALSLALAAREAGRAFRRLGRREDRAIVAGLAAGLLAILGQGAFDYVLRNAVANMAVWAMIGALLVCLREARRAASSR
jgi:O-antigen ligase